MYAAAVSKALLSEAVSPVVSEIVSVSVAVSVAALAEVSDKAVLIWAICCSIPSATLFWYAGVCITSLTLLRLASFPNCSSTAAL